MRTRTSHWTILAQLLLAAIVLLGSPSAQAQAFVGCFKDTNAFDLDGYLERSAENTPQRCIEVCSSRGFAFAGVQYGESCLCGNSYGKYGAANNCDYRCTGDAAQACGGYSANSVYTTGIAATNPPPPPPPPPTSDCTPGLGFECDTNRNGSDYAAFDLPQANPQLCLDRCRSDNSCRAWTYVKPGVQGANARCYLKNPEPPATPNNCCVSGAMPRIIDQQVNFEVNTNRNGSDYERFELQAANPDQCFERCRADSRCAAWTFVRPGVQGPLAVCYLKNPAPAPTPNDCCVSGAIAGGATPPVTPPPPPPPPPPTGNCWVTSRTFVEQHEGGPQAFRGVYTRRGSSNVFDVIYTRPGQTVPDELTLDLVGSDEVRVKRNGYSSVLVSRIDADRSVARGRYDGGTKFELTCGGQ